MRTGIRLGSIAGVEIVADWSLLIVFTLIFVSLGIGVLPQWHPEWGVALTWVTALFAATLFFASVLAHEMTHALVGRTGGIRVPRITLFVFGGMAHMESEPPSWGSEFRMAIVGPLASLAIGFFCLWASAALAGPIPPDGVEAAGEQLANLGPAATVLLWLGIVNIALGLFNLVPGFPLDGGRVLRAIIWGVTGDRLRATRLASAAGQGFAWLLMALGVLMLFGIEVPVFGSGIGGLWLILIGWFLNAAALFSYRQLQLREVLDEVPVGSLMQTQFMRADPNASVKDFVERQLIPSGQRAFPVERDGRLVGLVCMEDLRRQPRERWDTTPLSAVMTPVARLQRVGARQRAGEALDLLGQREINQLPVMEGDRLVGMISRETLVRWLSLKHPESLGEARGRRPAQRI